MIATREDIRTAAGRLILCGFDGTGVTAELREILREVRPAGLVLFARNVESPSQVAELCRELKDLRDRDPLLLAVDQEGGRVARIRHPATEWPPMRDLGRTGDDGLAERVGRALGRELRAMNIDVNLAPVLDVDTNPNNPVINDRALADEAERVADLGVALIRGMESAGVGACGKHFPGHGDTDLDSHIALPRVSHDLDRLRRIEWAPFKRAIDAGLGAVMTGHLVVEALDPKHPATLSRTALTPLRDELGFGGVILSDDIDTPAVAKRYDSEQVALLGINAGVDVFLACDTAEMAASLYRGIVVGVETEAISHDTLLEAQTRLLTWRHRFYRNASPRNQTRDVVGCAEHQALAQEIRVRAATMSVGPTSV